MIAQVDAIPSKRSLINWFKNKKRKTIYVFFKKHYYIFLKSFRKFWNFIVKITFCIRGEVPYIKGDFSKKIFTFDKCYEYDSKTEDIY